MEAVMKKGFVELSVNECEEVNGGVITLTTGAIIGLCCLGGGFVVGLIWG